MLLLSPAIDASVSPITIKVGDKTYVNGTSTANTKVYLWVFNEKGTAGMEGIDYYYSNTTPSNNNFSFELNFTMASGDYFVFIQSLGGDRIYSDGLFGTPDEFICCGIASGMNSSQILSVLEDNAKKTGSDDYEVYKILTYTVLSPLIWVDEIGDIVIGQELKVSGKAYFDDGTILNVKVEGPTDLGSKNATVIDEYFSVTFSTGGAVAGTYKAWVDDLAGNANFTVFSLVSPSCSDGIQNQGETGVDCGGPCDPCPMPARGGGGGGGMVIRVTPPPVVYSILEVQVLTLEIKQTATAFLSKTDVSEISITVYSPTRARIEISKLKSIPTNIEVSPSGVIYGYMLISSDIKEENIKEVEIKFKVGKSWIKENEIDEDSIKLLRYTEEWEELDTSKVEEDDANIYYKAISPRLSVFAVAGEEAKPLPTPTPTSTPTPTPIAEEIKTEYFPTDEELQPYGLLLSEFKIYSKEELYVVESQIRSQGGGAGPSYAGSVTLKKASGEEISHAYITVYEFPTLSDAVDAYPVLYRGIAGQKVPKEYGREGFYFTSDASYHGITFRIDRMIVLISLPLSEPLNTLEALAQIMEGKFEEETPAYHAGPSIGVIAIILVILLLGGASCGVWYVKRVKKSQTDVTKKFVGDKSFLLLLIILGAITSIFIIGLFILLGALIYWLAKRQTVPVPAPSPPLPSKAPSEIETLKERRAKIQDLVDKLSDRLAKGEISQSTYQELKQKYEKQIGELNKEIAEKELLEESELE
jgi:PGF-pre-PGF domain-containing protein